MHFRVFRAQFYIPFTYESISVYKYFLEWHALSLFTFHFPLSTFSQAKSCMLKSCLSDYQNSLFQGRVICPDFRIFTNRNVVILRNLLKDLSNKGKQSAQDLMKSNENFFFLLLLLVSLKPQSLLFRYAG